MKKTTIAFVLILMILMSAFVTTALAADDDEVTITGTIRESDGTPAEKDKYVVSITTDKMVCISGTNGFITLVPQFMDDTHIITVKENNVEVATADINLTHGDAYSFTATETGADIVVPTDMDAIQFDIIVDGDKLLIQELETSAIASSSQGSGGIMLYILIAVVVIAVIFVIILINKKKAKA